LTRNLIFSLNIVFRLDGFPSKQNIRAQKGKKGILVTKNNSFSPGRKKLNIISLGV